MNTKRKISIALLCIASIAVICAVPIVPIKAEVASGQTELPPQLEKIVTQGNFSVNFNLQNFTADMDNLYVSAESFTVTAQTTTVGNITTGFIILDLTNVNAKINNEYTLNVGKATLNMDIYAEGKNVKYTFYSDSASSIAELASNIINNI